jgi:hypothetical protein
MDHVPAFDAGSSPRSARPFRWWRAGVAWLAIIGAETVHGILRQLFLAPLVGDLPARQIGVAVGSVLIFAVGWSLSRWMGARTVPTQLAVGTVWVVLTLGFEAALGGLLGLSRERMLEDYDLAAGGLMGFGLLFMLLTPWLAARVRG